MSAPQQNAPGGGPRAFKNFIFGTEDFAEAQINSSEGRS
jgi:hypothetical protein